MVGDLCIHENYFVYTQTSICVYTCLCIHKFVYIHKFVCIHECASVYTHNRICVYTCLSFTQIRVYTSFCVYTFTICVYTQVRVVHDFSSRHLEVSVCGLLRWSLHVYWPRKIRDGCPSWMLRCSLARTSTSIRQFSTARQLWQGWRCSSPLPLTKREPAPKVHRCSIDSPHHYLFSCVAG